MSAAPQWSDLASEPGSTLGACFHCGEVLEASTLVSAPIAGNEEHFCCHGCAGAAELIEELGLGAYYSKRERPAPARGGDATPDSSLARFDAPALQAGFVTWEEDGSLCASLSVSGMRCAACSWLLEERLVRAPGVLEARFGLASQRARVRWDPAQTKLSELLGRVAQLGYGALPYTPDVEEAQLAEERRASLRRLGVAGLGAMQGMMFAVALYLGALRDLQAEHRDLLRAASGVVTTPVLFYAGWPFLRGAWRDLVHWRVGPDVPIALALCTAFFASVHATATGGPEVYFDSVCMFVFFLTLARGLERDLRARSELRIRGLQRRAPRTAKRIVGSLSLEGGAEEREEEEVPVTELAPGDSVLVRPGEMIPVDGAVLRGESSASEALLTGEEAPVRKTPGSVALAGSRNLDGELLLRVERVGPTSTLAMIGRLLDRAQLEKPPVAVLADRIARVFLAAVIVVAAAVGLAWWWIDASRVVPVVVAVLIATCPCALSLATPAALAAATHGLAARGLLVTRGRALEALARVTHVVFDKTGTLTAPAPVIAEIRCLRPWLEEAEVLSLARGLEAGSNHPIARALRATAARHAGSPGDPLFDDARSVPGCGVEGRAGSERLRLGQRAWVLEGASASQATSSVGESEASGTAPSSEPANAARDFTTWLGDERGLIAGFALETPLRPGASAAVARLRERGLRISLLSGDPAESSVAKLGSGLAADEAHANVTPEGKLAAVDGWVRGGDVVLAVGDGVNDAPLLGRAQVSVAMGSGSDLARTGADAVLLDDRLETLPIAIAWAHRVRRVVRQNFAWALGYNLAVLPLAAAGVLSPWLAALGMSLSSLVVVGNSLRLRRAPRGARAS